ncbi:hypothetical protein MMC15_000371 [Xylographa vitiligo]|nr:hypothetical protein [Xylographa vitiligo]
MDLPKTDDGEKSGAPSDSQFSNEDVSAQSAIDLSQKDDVEKNGAPSDKQSPDQDISMSIHAGKPPISLPREIAFVTIVCLAQLLTQAALGQAIAPLHIIAASFGSPNPGELSWFAAAYSLTVGTFILVAGRLGDIFGYKNLFLLGWLWFSLWSLIAGLSVYAHSEIFFDFCRAMQGVGPAVLVPNALAILGQTYPQGMRKNMIFALFGATAPGGFVVGAVFASLLAERASWPIAYYCMAIVCFLVAVCAMFIVPTPEKDPNGPHYDKSFDYIGAIVGIAGLVLFNVAWNQAPSVGWGTPYVIVLFILGLIFIIAFFLVERRVKQPLLPLDALSGNVGFVLGCIALGWSSFGVFLYYFWQFLAVLRQEAPLLTAAHNVPSAVSGLFASVMTGFLLSHIATSWIMVIAMCAFFIGTTLLATMPIDQSYWLQTFFATVITPFGMDMSFPAATIILSNFVTPEHQGIAASLVTTVVNYSISIGLGIAGTVQSQVDSDGTNNLNGYRGALYSGMGLSGCGILLSICFVMHERRMNQK